MSLYDNASQSCALGSVESAVIAMDGPSGTGKSTVARALAGRLGLRYLDTGAMYRAATIAVLDAGAGSDDIDAITAAVAAANIAVSTDVDDRRTWVDGVDSSARIRTQEVTSAVSRVSAVPAIRRQLVAQQRELIGGGGIVVEGRDIASVVWPTAFPKVYLTADANVRAARRSSELTDADFDSIRRDLQRRDAYDSSRSASPLIRTDDSVEVDTTYLSIDEVVDVLVDLVMGRPLLRTSTT